MFKKTIFNLSLISLLISTSAFANDTASRTTGNNADACLEQMDQKIGTLYLCGAGGKFKVLSLERCNIEDKDIPAIASYLEKHPRINALDLGQNNLGDTGMIALSNNKTLAWINVSYNHIGDKGAIALSKIPTLINLDIINNHVDKEGGIALANASLNTIDIARNNIGPDGAIALAKSSTLRIVYADFNHIGTKAASAFSNNTSITHLYIGSNDIDDTAAIALASNPHITELGLEYNNISNAGALALASNTTLRWLYWHYNHIGPAGIAALDNNSTLVEVVTEGNDGTTVASHHSIKMIRPRLSSPGMELSTSCTQEKSQRLN
jgi:hypothetical protein